MKGKVKVKSLSRVWLLATRQTAAYQAPLSMGFSRQEYWSGVPLPSPYSLTVCYNSNKMFYLFSYEVFLEISNDMTKFMEAIYIIDMKIEGM